MELFSIAFAILLSAKTLYASWVWTEVCTHTARRIKIQSTTPLSMREVRVFSGDVNVAIGKTATQSSDLNDSSGASKAVDGKWRTKATTDVESNSTWWEVDLEEPTSINKVLIVNPKCADDLSCSCKLSHAVISLLDDDGKIVSSEIVGDTCDKRWVARKFEFECGPILFDPNYNCQNPLGCYEVKEGICLDSNGYLYENISALSISGGPTSDQECKDTCPVTAAFRGITTFDYKDEGVFQCVCLYDQGTRPETNEVFTQPLDGEYHTGTGLMYAANGIGYEMANCYKWHPPIAAGESDQTSMSPSR